MKGASFERLRRIETPGGDVFHGLKASEPAFAGFGEAYFTTVERGYVKGWKRHRRMTLNLIVPVGEVRICVVDDHTGAHTEFDLGPESSETYGRLTVQPGLWVAFGGARAGLNLMLNLASTEHDPLESETRALSAFGWSWRSS